MEGTFAHGARSAAGTRGEVEVEVRGRTQNARDLDQLVVVVVAVEEGLLAEDHRGQHAPQGPHVQRIVVHLVVDKKFRPLEVPERGSLVLSIL